ncbi:hypothetical protein [Streptomyces sp. NBC_00564]|uniref:hypothetical protein n=1 Tax=Streptomyces sp. NBC_00564 TaxID=2903663 RepID=UPI002FCD82A3|nr:hypothetical protein OG256_43985 [Streptomyces sp. NBC_00564]
MVDHAVSRGLRDDEQQGQLPQIIDEPAEHRIGCGAVTGRARERRLVHLGGVAQKLQDHVLQLRTVRSRLLHLELPGARSRHQYLAEQ